MTPHRHVQRPCYSTRGLRMALAAAVLTATPSFAITGATSEGVFGVQAGNAADQCPAIAKWSERFRREYPDLDVMKALADQVSDRAVNLFSDEDFVPVFGKPFDAMSQAEREDGLRSVAA